MPVPAISFAVMRADLLDQFRIARAPQADVVREDHGAADVVVPVHGVDAVENRDAEPRGQRAFLKVVSVGRPARRADVGNLRAAAAQHRAQEVLAHIVERSSSTRCRPASSGRPSRRASCGRAGRRRAAPRATWDSCREPRLQAAVRQRASRRPPESSPPRRRRPSGGHATARKRCCREQMLSVPWSITQGGRGRDEESDPNQCPETGRIIRRWRAQRKAP